MLFLERGFGGERYDMMHYGRGSRFETAGRPNHPRRQTRPDAVLKFVHATPVRILVQTLLYRSNRSVRSLASLKRWKAAKRLAAVWKPPSNSPVARSQQSTTLHMPLLHKEKEHTIFGPFLHLPPIHLDVPRRVVYLLQQQRAELFSYRRIKSGIGERGVYPAMYICKLAMRAAGMQVIIGPRAACFEVEMACFAGELGGADVPKDLWFGIQRQEQGALAVRADIDGRDRIRGCRCM